MYSASSGALLLCETVFGNGNRLHGVSSTATEHGALLVLHGDRLAQARFIYLQQLLHPAPRPQGFCTSVCHWGPLTT